MTDLAARAVRPGRIPAKASCRPEDHRLPSADGTDDGDRHRGRRQADGQMRSSRRPQGSSLAPASGEGAQVLPGGLAVQFKLRAGADGRAAEHHGDDAGPASPGAAARPRRRGRVDGRGRGHDWRPRRRRGVRGGPGMLSGQATWCRSRVPDPSDKLARTVEVIAPAGLRPSSKNWRRRPRPAMPGRPSNDGRTSRPSTGSATSPNRCPP